MMFILFGCDLFFNFINFVDIIRLQILKLFKFFILSLELFYFFINLSDLEMMIDFNRLFLFFFLLFRIFDKFLIRLVDRKYLIFIVFD